MSVEEGLGDFNDILNLVVAIPEECKQYMEEWQINNSDECLDEVDEIIFNFKRKVYSWLKETNEDDRCWKTSSETKSNSSRSSRRTSKSNGSGSSESDRIEGKVRLVDLLAKETVFEKCQQVENETKRLRMQEKLAKARAKTQILQNVEFREEQKLQGEILRNSQ